MRRPAFFLLALAAGALCAFACVDLSALDSSPDGDVPRDGSLKPDGRGGNDAPRSEAIEVEGGPGDGGIESGPLGDAARESGPAPPCSSASLPPTISEAAAGGRVVARDTGAVTGLTMVSGGDTIYWLQDGKNIHAASTTSLATGTLGSCVQEVVGIAGAQTLTQLYAAGVDGGDDLVVAFGPTVDAGIAAACCTWVADLTHPFSTGAACGYASTDCLAWGSAGTIDVFELRSPARDRVVLVPFGKRAPFPSPSPVANYDGSPGLDPAAAAGGELGFFALGASGMGGPGTSAIDQADFGANAAQLFFNTTTRVAFMAHGGVIVYWLLTNGDFYYASAATKPTSPTLGASLGVSYASSVVSMAIAQNRAFFATKNGIDYLETSGGVLGGGGKHSLVGGVSGLTPTSVLPDGSFKIGDGTLYFATADGTIRAVAIE